MWETENGPQDGDEINFVESGFNSGWNEIYGFSSSQKAFDKNELVTFDDKGHYGEPKLVWAKSTGLTSIVFLDSDLEVGPDGYLYVVSIGPGKLFRILTK